jgi:hypothetical protein
MKEASIKLFTHHSCFSFRKHELFYQLNLHQHTALAPIAGCPQSLVCGPRHEVFISRLPDPTPVLHVQLRLLPLSPLPPSAAFAVAPNFSAYLKVRNDPRPAKQVILRPQTVECHRLSAKNLAGCATTAAVLGCVRCVLWVCGSSLTMTFLPSVNRLLAIPRLPPVFELPVSPAA